VYLVVDEYWRVHLVFYMDINLSPGIRVVVVSLTSINIVVSFPCLNDLVGLVEDHSAYYDKDHPDDYIDNPGCQVVRLAAPVLQALLLEVAIPRLIRFFIRVTDIWGSTAVT
jgi:hypothetical protein